MRTRRPSRWANSGGAAARKAWRASWRRKASTSRISSSTAGSARRRKIRALMRGARTACCCPTRSPRTTFTCTASTAARGRGSSNFVPGSSGFEMSTNMRHLLAAILLFPCLALAQAYPSKPVRVIVPFPPGGTTDLVARIVQPKFQEFIGNTVVIENRSGAGGSVGALEAAQAAPDGYTLLMVFDTHAVNHHIFRMAPDPFKAFEHIMLMVTSPSLLVGVSNFAPNTLAELVARAKAQPERVTYATPGSGSSNHLGALLVQQYAGIKMTQVAYQGGGPMIQALLGSHVDIAFISTPLILPHVQAGEGKGIAIGGQQRVFPNSRGPPPPPDFSRFQAISSVWGARPAGIRKEISMRVWKEMARTLEVPEVRQRLAGRGVDVRPRSPPEVLRVLQGAGGKPRQMIPGNKDEGGKERFCFTGR